MYTGSEGLSLQANFVILGLLRLEMLSFVTRFNISENSHCLQAKTSPEFLGEEGELPTLTRRYSIGFLPNR
jgi:hypothetical protein